MAVSSINIAPSVIAAAVVNITGNLSGLRHTMNEARAQLYGFLTASNAVGGKWFALVFNPIAVRSGMRAIDNAMAKAEQEFEQRTAMWRKARPRAGHIIPPNLQRDYPELYNEFTSLPAHLQTARGYRKFHANFKPDRAKITEEIVQPAAFAQQKMLMLATAIGVVGAVLAKAAEYASAFNEQLNKTIQTFGVSSSMLTRNAANAASGGLSRTAYLGGTSTLGIELLGAGVDEKAASQISATLAERAKDIASLYDIEVGTVLDKIRAGLAGFGRPLKELGIVITESRVEAKAAAMGLREHNGYLSEESKIRARTALIMELSQRAEGDFARTQGEYANQMRILSANAENAMTELGKFGQAIATGFMPFVNHSVGMFEQMIGAVNQAGSGIYGIVGGVASAYYGQGYGGFSAYGTEMDELQKRNASRANQELRDQIKEDEEAGRKSKSVRHYDLAGYAKHLQESLFDKNNARDQLTTLKQIARNTAKPGSNRVQYAPGSIAPEFPM